MSQPNNQRIYVCLGRLGDQINLLPLLHEDNNNGDRPAMMVGREFAGHIASGCSYYDEIVFNGSMWELDQACKQADLLSSRVIVTQLVGPYEVVKSIVVTRNGVEYRTTTESYQKDAWMIAGRFDDWKKQPPLIFNKRSAERERKIVEKWVKKKPIILLSCLGTSSPFAYSKLLTELVTRRFGHRYNVINVAEVQSERIYDLLCLYERAHCLIATDSAPLHLAHAVKTLPVIALTADKPSLWHGSVWRPNHIGHVRYSDFPERCVQLLDAIEQIGKPGNWFAKRISQRKIVHVWAKYELPPAYEERHAEACSTWNKAYDEQSWVSTPIEIGAVGRDSSAQLKDEKRLCFVKDLLRLATMRTTPEDIICVTRPDTCFEPDITDIIMSNPLSYAHRIERGENDNSWHPAIEMICMPSKWWVENQGLYPDFVLGRDPYWHRIFYELLKAAGAADITGCVWRRAGEPWKPQKIEQLPPRVVHNEKLFTVFMTERKIEHMFPPVTQQLETLPLNRRSLSAYGYNGSVIRYNDRTLLAYRWHRDGTPATRLMLAEIDVSGNAITNLPIDAGEEHSVDDPRLFLHSGDLYISLVLSTWPKLPTTSVITYGKLLEVRPHTIKGMLQPAYGGNEWHEIQKNWVFFEFDGRIYVIYQCQPKQVVFELAGIVHKDVFDTPSLQWNWGEIKGGTPPLPYQGKLLRFFHSTLDNEPPPWRRRYYLGAMLLEATPPFKQLRISRSPIARGSESDELTPMERLACIHRKPKVIFPAGVMTTPEGWAVSCGINDCAISLLHVKENDLHL